jgi:hypothetical protein
VIGYAKLGTINSDKKYVIEQILGYWEASVDDKILATGNLYTCLDACNAHADEVKKMCEREELLKKMKEYKRISEEKKKEYYKEEYYKYNPECGCIVREDIMIMAMLPQMLKLGITLEDLEEKE